MAVLSQCVVAFDERRASPASNVGTLGSAGDVTWTGTRRIVPGSVAYVALPGVTSNYLSVPDAAALDITGDIEMVARITMPDWTPSADGTLVGKWVGPSNLAYYWLIQTTGTMRLYTSANGSSSVDHTSSAATGFTDGATGWVKVTRASASGQVLHYIAADAGSNTEPTSWTQLGTAGSTTAGGIFAGTAAVGLGARSDGAGALSGNVHRLIIRSGIGGSTVLDVDTSVLTDESATSFTATTGQTVTINRSTGATYMTAVVVPGRPKRLFNGSSDYGEVADNASLDFGASDSFTVWALIRTWATFGTNDSIVAKKANTTDTTAGWSIGNGPSTAAQVRAEIGDGTNGVGCTTSASRTSGALTMVSLVRSVAADTIAAGIDGTLATPVTDTTTGSLANSEVVRFGRLSGAGTEYTPMRVYAWGIYPGVMTATQLATLKTELTGADTSVGPRVATLSVPTREVALSVDSREVALSVPTRTLELTV